MFIVHISPLPKTLPSPRLCAASHIGLRAFSPAWHAPEHPCPWLDVYVALSCGFALKELSSCMCEGQSADPGPWLPCHMVTANCCTAAAPTKVGCLILLCWECPCRVLESVCDSTLRSLESACLSRLPRSIWTRIPVHWFVDMLPRWARWLGAWALLAVLTVVVEAGPHKGVWLPSANTCHVFFGFTHL